MNGKQPLCGRPETKAASGRCENAAQVLAQASASSPCCLASQERALECPQLKVTLCPANLNFFSSKKEATKSVYHFKVGLLVSHYLWLSFLESDETPMA
jgi:hypothetical protein